MSPADDHLDDMRRDPGLDERLAEDILRGRTSALNDEHQPLAQAVETIRSRAESTPPEPSDALRHVFAHGVDAGEAPEVTAAPTAAPVARRGGRVRRLLPRAAGLSLVVKLALTGAAAAAIAGGAGAAGVLPGQSDGPAQTDESEPGRRTADEAVTGDLEGEDVADRAHELGDGTGEPGRRSTTGGEAEIEPHPAQRPGEGEAPDALETGARRTPDRADDDRGNDGRASDDRADDDREPGREPTDGRPSAPEDDDTGRRPSTPPSDDSSARAPRDDGPDDEAPTDAAPSSEGHGVEDPDRAGPAPVGPSRVSGPSTDPGTDDGPEDDHGPTPTGRP